MAIPKARAAISRSLIDTTMSYTGYANAGTDFEDPFPALQRANRFTLADLEQNRNGKISEAQRTRLFLRPLKPIRYTGAALLGWLFVCAVVKALVPTFVLWFLATKG